jgi:hypothetical protein
MSYRFSDLVVGMWISNMTRIQDEDKFPGDTYTCEETIIEISVEQSSQCGPSKRYKKLVINWQILDEHLEGFGDLFSKGRKLTFSIEFVYKEVTGDSTTAKGKKKKSATKAQKLQRTADAGLWSRLYELHRCRAKHSKQGPHCLPEGEKEEDVDVDIDIEDSSTDCRHCKAHASETIPVEDPGDVEGERQAKLEEYYN